MLRILSFVDTLALIFVVSMPPWIMLAHVFDLRFSPQFHNPFGSFLNVELPENGKESGRIIAALCVKASRRWCVHNTCSASICANMLQHIQAACVVCATGIVKQC